jgi:adenylosuccinate synthase
MVICDIVVGLQYGDEGKGKVCYNLCSKGNYQYCIRYNGKPDVGHTIYTDNRCEVRDTKIVLNQVPVGVLLGIPSIIGTGCIIDVERLEEEINNLTNLGIKHIRDNLYISHNSKILDSNNIKKKHYVWECIDIFKRLKLSVINIPEYFLSLRNNFIKVLFEGSQGFLNDRDWGENIGNNSTVCTSGGIVCCGIPLTTIRNIYGVAKIYETFIGNKSYDIRDDLLYIKNREKEDRECDWLNINKLKIAIAVNGCTHVIFNKCDILESIKKFKVRNTLTEKMLFNNKSLDNYNIVEFNDMISLKKYVNNELEYSSLKFDNKRGNYKIDIIYSGDIKELDLFNKNRE